MIEGFGKSLVLVTGASRGVGLSIARCLSAAGYGVVAASRSRSEELDALIEATVRSGGGPIEYRGLDLARHDSFHEFTSRLKAEFGVPYGVVHNAAIARDGVLATLHDSDIAAQIAVNLTGTILLTKYILRAMLTRGGAGRIVLVSSIAASTGFTGLSVYGATKAGLHGFALSLAREIGRLSVTVNTVSPGFMETAMSEGLNPEQRERIRRRSPLGTLAEPDDIAAAVHYLLSPEAARITGTDLTIDAGSSI